MAATKGRAYWPKGSIVTRQDPPVVIEMLASRQNKPQCPEGVPQRLWDYYLERKNSAEWPSKRRCETLLSGQHHDWVLERLMSKPSALRAWKLLSQHPKSGVLPTFMVDSEWAQDDDDKVIDGLVWIIATSTNELSDWNKVTDRQQAKILENVRANAKQLQHSLAPIDLESRDIPVIFPAYAYLAKVGGLECFPELPARYMDVELGALLDGLIGHLDGVIDLYGNQQGRSGQSGAESRVFAMNVTRYLDAHFGSHLSGIVAMFHEAMFDREVAEDTIKKAFKYAGPVEWFGGDDLIPRGGQNLKK